MSEEEKNLEEIDLLKEAEESEEEIREETPEEEREPLSPEDLKDVRDLLDEVRELRGGLRGAADPNMIQKHLDNFLAALCGETPVDSNVRTSTEYWLKRLADGEGGSTKKIYVHNISIVIASGAIRTLIGFNIYSQDDTAYTLLNIVDAVKAYGKITPVSGGSINRSLGTDSVVFSTIVIDSSDIPEVYGVNYSSMDIVYTPLATYVGTSGAALSDIVHAIN